MFPLISALGTGYTTPKPFTAVFQRIHVSLVLREQANGGVTTLKNRTRKSRVSAHAFRVQVGAVVEKELNGAVVEVIAISNTHIWWHRACFFVVIRMIATLQGLNKRGCKILLLLRPHHIYIPEIIT